MRRAVMLLLVGLARVCICTVTVHNANSQRVPRGGVEVEPVAAEVQPVFKHSQVKRLFKDLSTSMRRWESKLEEGHTEVVADETANLAAGDKLELSTLLGAAFEDNIRKMSPSSLPRIFVYDLPAKFNTAISDKWPQFKTDPLDEIELPAFKTAAKVNYVLQEMLFHRLMLHHNPLRTTNPAEATMFFVPVYLAAHCLDTMGGPGFTNKRWRTFQDCTAAQHIYSDARDWLEAHATYSKYWSRNGGSDHVWLSIIDFGPCLVHWPPIKVPAFLRAGSFITLFGDAQEFKSGGTPRSRECYEPQRDFMVPPFIFSESFFAPARQVKDIFAYFRGTTHGMNYEGGHVLKQVRVDLLLNMKHKGKACGEGWADGPLKCKVHGQPVYSTDALITPKKYSDQLKRSTFCLCPPGVAIWTFRFFEAIAASCIPVLFDQGNAVLPYSVFIDYEDFLVRVPPERAKFVLDDLAKISSDRLDAMRKALVQARKFLVYKRLSKASNDTEAVHPMFMEMIDKFVQQPGDASRKGAPTFDPLKDYTLKNATKTYERV